MRKWLPLIAISLGSFMLMIDVTIVTVAMPNMAVDLSTSFGSLQWVIDAYALALAVLLIGTGAVADARGHRRTFLVGLVLFALASVACGLAPTGGFLVAARAVQGIGAAAMFSTTFALINNSYTGRERGTAYGVFGAVSGAAAALGPVIGGLLTQGISWRWIFFVNVPISVITIALTLVAVPARHDRVRGRRVDLAGIATFTVAAAALTFALIRSSEDGWTSPLVITLFVVAVLGLAGFVTVESRSRQPLVDLSLFREPRFSGTVLAALVLCFSAYGVLTYTTIWTQTLLGLTPTEAGLVALPLPALVTVLSLLSGRFMDRVPRPLAIGGGIVLVGLGGLLTALLVTPDAGWAALIPGLAVSGIGLGMSFPILSRTATEAAGDGRSGMASGAINTARQLGQAFGIALLGSLAAGTAASTLASAGTRDPMTTSTALFGGQAQSVLATASAGHHDDLERLLHTAMASGLDLDYVVAGSLAVVTGVLVTWLLHKRSHSDDAAPQQVVEAGPQRVGQRP